MYHWIYQISSLIICCTLGFLTSVQAQSSWPSKPVRIIVPFAPGGNVDVTARVVGAAMSKLSNQTFIVENRAGASGKIGAEAAIKSPADGYTLLMGSNSSLSVAPNLFKDWPYDPVGGISPASYLAAVPFVLVVRPGLGTKNLAEVIALARQKPNGLSMASAGNGSSNHLVGEYFQAMTGVQFLHVPYKGAGPALQDVVAGRVDLLFDQVSSSSAFIEQGRVTPIAVSSAERWKSLPQTPSFVEAGISNFIINNFTGLVAPKGTPNDVIQAIQALASQALQDEAVKKSFATMGVQAIGAGPTQFSQVIREDLQRWALVIREKNISLD